MSLAAQVYTDVALDPYNSDGHDGIVRDDGVIMNDPTVDFLCRCDSLLGRAGRPCSRGISPLPSPQLPVPAVKRGSAGLAAQPGACRCQRLLQPSQTRLSFAGRGLVPRAGSIHAHSSFVGVCLLRRGTCAGKPCPRRGQGRTVSRPRT